MMRRRAAAQVLVAGHAWLGALVASALAGAGVGHVDPALDGWTQAGDAAIGGLLPADTHRSRASAAADAVRRAAPETRIAPLRAGTATFVVRVGLRPGSALATRGVRERGSPRLDVYLRDGLVVVGPLVVPGGSPCGQCLELHRRDRDPAWPALAAQLATGREGVEACAVTTALAGAAYAVAEVLAYLDGRPVHTFGAMVEVSGPGRSRRRSWSAHPACDCRRRRRSSPIRRLPGPPSNNGS
jgi:bacteriocin biosynthesis cyclodehydratase domain-containing protein